MSSQPPTGAAVPAAADGPGGAKGHGSPRTGSKKTKKKSRDERELEQAARSRRRDAQEKYRSNPPKPEDEWICHFCEYEMIFGEPPRTLIRDYEIKDRKLRRQEAERKRLLEKAKAKSRKGRKNPKSPTKNAQASHSHGDHVADTAPGQSASTGDESDYINGREDDFEVDEDDPPMLLSDDPDPDYADEFDRDRSDARRYSTMASIPAARPGPAAAAGSI